MSRATVKYARLLKGIVKFWIMDMYLRSLRLSLHSQERPLKTQVLLNSGQRSLIGLRNRAVRSVIAVRMSQLVDISLHRPIQCDDSLNHYMLKAGV